MEEKKLSTCHQSPYYYEELKMMRDWDGEGPLLRTFGRIAVCSDWKCRKPIGRPEITDKDLSDDFNGSSWSMMLQVHPFTPFVFVMGPDDYLIPETWGDK